LYATKELVMLNICWRPKDPKMSVSSASAIVQDNVMSTNEENDLKAKPQRNWVFVEGSEYVSDIVPVVSSWTQSTVSEDDRDNFQRCSHRSNWNVLWCRKVVQEGVTSSAMCSWKRIEKFFRVTFMGKRRDVSCFSRTLLNECWKQMTLALRFIVWSPPCQGRWKREK
jgi:hypothetical protein